MSTPQARILQVCDAVAAHLRTVWSPTGDDRVTRTYGPDIGLSVDDEATLIAGRQVYVFPTSYAVPVQVTRREVEWRYAVSIIVAERYDEDGETAGLPPNSWMDARVAFVADKIFKPLRDQHLTLLGTVIPSLESGGETAEVLTVYDLDVYREHRAFWSQINVPFEEVNQLWQ